MFVRLNHVACFIVNANHCIIPNPGLPIGVPKFEVELAAAFHQIGRWTLDVGLFACKRGGPVAQRLEQGTHNSRKSFCAHFHRLAQWCGR
ncbi:MAG: hypothetical protein DME56_12760 [Verrucomicrobia bacterium]|nr:MAG: hypothetical protein DME56_12760 [Verrucomicrobiota bacterium]